jgi:putative membrane protein
MLAKIWAAIGTVFAIAMGSPVLAQPARENLPRKYFHGNHMWEGGAHGWFMAPLMMILFIAIAVVVIVLLVRWLGGPTHGHRHDSGHRGAAKATPFDILDERFARGEIDSAEYRERLGVLRE